MPLIKTAILPHSPLLIPEIGRENRSFLQKTVEAYGTVGNYLKENPLDTLLVISPHGAVEDSAFNLNVAPEMFAQFKDFGFFPAREAFAGDAPLADKIKTELKDDFPINLISETELDYGTAIPAYILREALGSFKLLSLSPAASLSLEDHYRFGKALRPLLAASPRKTAVIASSDLSHRLKKKSPAGYSPKGARFDNRLLEALRNPDTAIEDILKMDPGLIKDAGECGLKPICIALGLVADSALRSETLAYQTDFGIGYLSLDFTDGR